MTMMMLGLILGQEVEEQITFDYRYFTRNGNIKEDLEVIEVITR